jgi:hypothetical protein
MSAYIDLRDSGDRSSAPVEVTVDREPADTELRRNLCDGVQPVPVRAGLLVHPHLANQSTPSPLRSAATAYQNAIDDLTDATGLAA